MFILYIRLENYTRFPLRPNPVFEHHFKHRLTVITGPNGSGKSSLFSELTPLPTSKEFFTTNGYKEIHIEHRGRQYRLICDFRGSAKYHFFCDEEELNLANNVTAQRALVEQHFNITDTTHDLLTGAEHFTTMSLANRKKLFAAIMRVNIDEVLAAYTALKEELRTNERVLKTQMLMLQSEELKLADATRINTLMARQEAAQSEIDYLFKLRDESMPQSARELDDLLGDYKQLTHSLETFVKSHHILITAHPRGELDTRISELQSQVLFHTNLLNTLYDQYESEEALLKVLANTQSKDRDVLCSELARMQEERTRLSQSIQIARGVKVDTATARQQISNIFTDITDIVATLPEDVEGVYTRDALDALSTKLIHRQEALTKLLNERVQLIAEKEALERAAHDVSCPKCDYSWTTTQDPARLTELAHRLSSVAQSVSKLQEEIGEIVAVRDVHVEHQANYQRLATIIRASRASLDALWDEVIERQHIRHSPKSVLLVINAYLAELDAIDAITTLEQQTRECQEAIATLDQFKDANATHIQRKLEELAQSIGEHQMLRSEAQSALEYAKRASGLYATLDTMNQALGQLQRAIDHSQAQEYRSVIRRTIEAELSARRVELIEITKEISAHSEVSRVVETYRAQVLDTQMNINALTAVTEHLCPKKGLIATSISTFLNDIISNMNKVLRGIWHYHMQLKAISLGDDVLDYRFKLDVEHRLAVGDISLASSGMKEGIDMAFRFVLYKLLGLEGYPLWLDEFGVRLDAQNKASITRTIFSILSSDTYSQSFMITHMDLAYERFGDVGFLEMG